MDWRRFAIIALVITVLFGIVVAIGHTQNSPVVIITSMLATTIAVATPLTLGALSGLWCERAGVVNIGIEGMMLGAAFFGWLACIYMSSIFHFPVGPSLAIGVIVGDPERRALCAAARGAVDHLQSGSNHRRDRDQYSRRRASRVS